MKTDPLVTALIDATINLTTTCDFSGGDDVALNRAGEARRVIAARLSAVLVAAREVVAVTSRVYRPLPATEAALRDALVAADAELTRTSA